MCGFSLNEFCQRTWDINSVDKSALSNLLKSYVNGKMHTYKEIVEVICVVL